MTVTNSTSGTNVHEVAEGIYRINTPVQFEGGGGFSFNQYLVVDDDPLLFHTGLRKLFPLVREAVASVLPLERLRYIAFSHVEADECGSLNEWLAAAPQSVPLCGAVAAMVSINDLADRAPRAIADGERISLGTHSVRWLDAPHLPHAWECGFLTEERTSTLLCSDLFTQGGADCPPLTGRIFLGRARRSATGWTISPTRRMRGRCLRNWPPPSRRHSRACTAAHGTAMGRNCCAHLLMHCRSDAIDPARGGPFLVASDQAIEAMQPGAPLGGA
jgi:glyoxylase-like metal-dependent hydrolase (beta-lactamase superfamily II)